jgi:membrane fusion protein (multidrug efflux system)
MLKRMLLMLAVVLLFVAAVGSVKFFQIKSAIAQGKSYQPPPEAVTTALAQMEPWQTTVNAIGTVAAVNGVTVSADLPGVVQEILFDSGKPVNKGDILARLDTRQERAQLAAAEAQRDVLSVNLQRAKGLLAGGVLPQSEFDGTAAQFKEAEARVGEIRATIERKTIRAPFSGVLGIRQINLGQYLEGGAPIVSLQALRPAYVNFTVPEQELSKLSLGARIAVTSDAFSAPENGRINAVDSHIDEATRNVRVQAIFDNAAGLLRPGMYVQAQLPRGKASDLITLPASAISYAPFGDSVFIVEQMTSPDGKPYRGVRQQFVKLGTSRGDQVAILTGVKAGEEVVTSGVFKLRPSAAVQVNNSVQPSNNPAPKPEDS